MAAPKEDIIPVALSRGSMPVSGLRMLVSDFADLRSDRRRLRSTQSFFGTSMFVDALHGGSSDDSDDVF